MATESETKTAKSGIQGESPEASCVSMKSDWSMKKPPSFSETDPVSYVSVLFGKSPEASCVSMKSDWSMKKTPSFNETDPVSNVRNNEDNFYSHELSHDKKKQLDSIFNELEDNIIFLIKKELKSFKDLLRPDDLAYSENKEKDEGQKRVRDGLLKITLHVMRKMKQTDLANMLQTKLAPLYMKKHKSRIKEKFQIINEGILNPGSATLLHRIYTDLYITKGGAGKVNTEHEVRRMKTSTRSAEIQETPIKCKDMFKGRSKPIRTVLTTGVSGIGKTVSVQKFILDWAEGNDNQDLHFIFPLPFRELNLIKDKNLSLLELLCHYFTDMKKMRLTLESNQTIIRGLFPFTERGSHSPMEIVEYIKQKIRENPSPEKSINLFHCLNELNDHSLVQEVQTYLSKAGARHLHGVQLSPSHWSALVFVLLHSEEELNQFTLSKYIRSEECLLRLLPVIKASSKANLSGCNLTERSCSALTTVLSSNSSNLKELNLSHNKLQDSGMKLLSAGLENSNCYIETLILSDCRIGEEGCASLASALRSNPSHLRELNLNFSTLGNLGNKLFDVLTDPQCRVEKLKLNNCSIPEEGCAALASALTSNPSHLIELNLGHNKLGDSGVKGLSDLLENPQSKLQKLQLFNCSIPEGGCAALASALITNPSNLRELNLGYNNLSDSGMELLSKLLENPQCKLKKLKLYNCSITKEQCADLVSALRSNPSHLTELNLNGNNLQDSGVMLLSDLLKDIQCKLEKLQLYNCHIGVKGCAALFTALRANPSHLAELDLSCNKPECSALQLLSDLLKDPNCTLEKLQLSSCCIEEAGCAALVSALRSKTTHLRELNLRCNKLGDSGDKLLSDLQKDPRCKLEKLHSADDLVPS